MRTLLTLALTAVLSAVAAPPAAAQVPEPPPVSGTWLVTFTPGSVKTVGDSIEAGLDDCEGSCGASYQFPDGLKGSPEANLVLRFDASGCTALPCQVGVSTTFDGFAAPMTYDGKTYRATGAGLYASATECREHLPADTDTMTFTVGGTREAPTLLGELTAVWGFVGPTDEKTGRCTGITGYDLYTGALTGRPADVRTAFAGAVPGVGAATPSATVAAAGEEAGEEAAEPGAAESATPERRADEVAARTHERPVLSTRVATARDLPWQLSSVAVSALLALLLVVLMPFPAALFNATLEENYAEVRGWFGFLRRGRGDAGAGREPRPTWLRFGLLVGGVAVLGAFLDPSLGLDRASLVLVAGLALAAVVVSLLGALPARLYARRTGDATALALYPLGLGVAAFCVLVSRLTSFEPGYLYGVVAGFGIARALRTDERGRLSVATSGALLVVAAAAFALRLPVHDAVADGGGGVPLHLLDTVLAAVFAAGVEANVLGLLPLRFLPGEPVFQWSKAVWGAVFGLNVFAFLHALSAAAGEASTGASVVVAAALFGAFATVSVAFWAFFRFRRKPVSAPSGDPSSFAGS